VSSLEISHLKVSLGQKLILNDLSFSLAEGQIAALLGPSGCGKTTLLRSIAGLIAPSDGTIRFGKQLVSLSSLVMPSHKRKIGYVPQEGALFPHLSVSDNAPMLLICFARATPLRSWLPTIVKKLWFQPMLLH